MKHKDDIERVESSMRKRLPKRPKALVIGQFQAGNPHRKPVADAYADLERDDEDVYREQLRMHEHGGRSGGKSPEVPAARRPHTVAAHRFADGSKSQNLKHTQNAMIRACILFFFFCIRLGECRRRAPRGQHGSKGGASGRSLDEAAPFGSRSASAPGVRRRHPPRLPSKKKSPRSGRDLFKHATLPPTLYRSAAKWESERDVIDLFVFIHFYRAHVERLQST